MIPAVEINAPSGYQGGRSVTRHQDPRWGIFRSIFSSRINYRDLTSTIPRDITSGHLPLATPDSFVDSPRNRTCMGERFLIFLQHHQLCPKIRKDGAREYLRRTSWGKFNIPVSFKLLRGYVERGHLGKKKRNSKQTGDGDHIGLSITVLSLRT